MAVKTITLKGSARERGRQLGEALRDQIRMSFEATCSVEQDNPERVQATTWPHQD